MLKVESLIVSHGPIEAVHGISFAVDQGRCVSLLGPNGAGKTSTISALMGVARSSGRIAFDGADISALSVESRVQAGMSVAPEGRRIFSNLSVEENLVLGGATRPDRDGKDADIARWFETFPILGERRDQLAGTLSGGEQQMLAISRALMTRPKILLLDEPSLGLAPKIVSQIFQMIEQLKAEGMTILLVEQNATQALRLSDYAYLLNNGQIVADGTKEALGQSSALMTELTGIA
ncbi:ABC transporter ATP-binding protein [uncultured Ruegeria sp.]|uniref:ABC transporter ATP-binding protein n=1 Tax=uncultured Ruegeria sp. TaxID=259304 RepID=UPI00260800CF|nr:ABC transporter ATP-binding protein [uncultured Ruegeria sp.]